MLIVIFPRVFSQNNLKEPPRKRVLKWDSLKFIFVKSSYFNPCTDIFLISPEKGEGWPSFLICFSALMGPPPYWGAPWDQFGIRFSSALIALYPTPTTTTIPRTISEMKILQVLVFSSTFNIFKNFFIKFKRPPVYHSCFCAENMIQPCCGSFVEIYQDTRVFSSLDWVLRKCHLIDYIWNECSAHVIQVDRKQELILIWCYERGCGWPVGGDMFSR